MIGDSSQGGALASYGILAMPIHDKLFQKAIIRFFVRNRGSVNHLFCCLFIVSYPVSVWIL